MRILIAALFFASAVYGQNASRDAVVSVAHQRVENLTSPLSIDTDRPRFSWTITSDKKDVRQTAYQIIVSGEKGEIWNSGRVASDQQLWIPFGGEALKSGMQCSWRVKVFTNQGETDWSEPQPFGIGLLKESHWSGRWIGLERMMPGEERGLHTRLAARYLRSEFVLDKPVKRALAYVAGIGLHELHVNGRVYNQEVLLPMPTDYRKTVLYNTYDITDALAENNCIGIVLGNGRVFPMRQDKPYKAPVFGLPKCRINILVTYTDGTTKRFSTDEKWKVTADGPIRSNNEYDGEEYDARRELTGWDRAGYDDSAWLQAERSEIPLGTLRAQMAPGMVMTPYPDAPRKLDAGIYDFHQNMAGWIAFTPTGQPGDTIRVKYAERLNADGTLYLDNLRDALSEDIYICGETLNSQLSTLNSQEWHPIFSYHGFRYAQITGPAEHVHAYTVSDRMRPTGTFECSDTIINKVVRNAWWGIYGNYKGMPVDCPQRNERQPWLGDRTMGSLGESFLFDNERLYTKWMRDICESQREDGVISDVAPAFWNYYNDDVTWPAALPFTCDMLYRQYGNREAIDRSYPYIKRWLQHLLDEYQRDGIITRDKYGDWCVPPERLELIHSEDPTRKTDGALISTAYVIRVMQLLEQWGCEADHWRPMREQMSEAFNRKFLTVSRGTSPRPGHVLYPDSVFYGNNTVTANLLPLAIGIVPDDCKDEVVRQVVQNICIKSNLHVSCGVIGISWLMRGLSDNGFADVAYHLATTKTYPSWGYMTENGATTIWELWNGDKASPKMNSGNHVMLLGDLLTWCYQYLGGIRSSDAYRHIVLRPAFDIQDCEWANVDYDSPYGTVKSHWQKTLQHLEWDVTVPCNTTADVCLPDGTTKSVGSGTYHFSCDIPTAHPAILTDQFLYEHTYFPEAHASTIVELDNGDLVAGYFGGTHERDPDVCIWVNIKKKGSNEWSQPILAADGVLSLDDPNARFMGLSGLKDDTTPATNGPIRTENFKGIAGANSSLFTLHSSLNYDYITKTTRLTDVSDRLKRKACWNPVLYQMPDGELWLFFKIGSSVGDWTGWITKSRDGGLTWSDKEPLPFDADGRAFLGPIKNKPELIGDRLLCPSSTEKDGWRFHMEILDLKTRQWKYVPVESTVAVKTDDNQPHPIDCIQPSILRLSDGRLQVLMRTHNAHIATSYSSDNGDTWTPVTLLDVENNQSGTDAVTLKDGRHALVYNNFETLPMTKKGPRTPLSLALSSDGQTWHHVLTLEDSPIDQYSYPAIIQGSDGTLHCVYTWRRQRIVYKKIDASTVCAHYGPVGFVNYNDGINGITGGGKGQVVRVSNRQDLARYAQSAEPYVIIVEGKLEGNGLNRQRDVIDVHSDKTIVGTKGAELAGIGLNINGQQNIIIRNLIIHHADPDGIAARNSHHIWVDHCEVYSQDEADKEDWDGLIDLTVGSSYLTVSYCYIHDHHKACLLNSGTMHFEDNGKNRATYHHNAFVRTDQRNPRIGYGLGHVFCNYYQDIGSYAIGMHTQAQVLSEHNYFGTNVNHPFEQMYASSLDDAACAYFDDRGSHFTKALPSGFKYQPTGTAFTPSQWYDYAFALDNTAAVSSLYPSQTGPQEGLEHEPILWPGNGATDLPLSTRPQFSNIENMTSAQVFWGTAPSQLQPLADLTSLQLTPSTTYYWKVEAQNDKGTHSSPVYHFTTASRKAAKPYPADGESNAQLRVATAANAKTAPMSLSWQPAADAKTYQVHLSTAADALDSQLVASTSATTCNPGTLLYGETYYWRVDVVTSDGETLRGDVWTFSAPACAIQTGRTEMEHLARSAYAYLEREDGSWFKASNDSVTVGEAGPGAMTGVWTGEDGRYRVSIDFYDEKSGLAWMALSVNDVLVDSWQGSKQYGMTTHQISEPLLLHKGDQLRIDFYTQSKMRCRIDCIDVEPANS